MLLLIFALEPNVNKVSHAICYADRVLRTTSVHKFTFVTWELIRLIPREWTSRSHLAQPAHSWQMSWAGLTKITAILRTRLCSLRGLIVQLLVTSLIALPISVYPLNSKFTSVTNSSKPNFIQRTSHTWIQYWVRHYYPDYYLSSEPLRNTIPHVQTKQNNDILFL